LVEVAQQPALDLSKLKSGDAFVVPVAAYACRWVTTMLFKQADCIPVKSTHYRSAIQLGVYFYVTASGKMTYSATLSKIKAFLDACEASCA